MLETLHNKIDICKEPFSDIGSRLLVFQKEGESELLIKLAERLTGITPGLASYLFRPPFIQGLYFLDEKGNKLEFITHTSPYCLSFETKIGLFQMVFQDVDTLIISLPANKTIGLHFVVNHLHVLQNPDGVEVKHVKNFAYKSNADILQNDLTPDANGLMVDLTLKSNEDQWIAIRISSKQELVIKQESFQVIASKAKQRWQTIFDSLPIVEGKYQEKYAFAWWVLLNNIVSPKGFITRNTVMPSKAFYIGAWLWDCALHAIALRHLDAKLAQDQIRVMLDHQLPDGMIPDALYDEGIVAEIDHPIKARVTKPPILAWAVQKLFDKDPDIEFIQEIYPQLVRENAWWFSQNDLDANGIVEYSHPYSSGLDDSPLWDGEMPVESPDINTYLYLQMENLAWMAEELGKSEEAAMWQTRAHALLKRMISTMWDEKAGLFWATHNQEPVEVITPINLYPLWTGKLSDEMVEKIIEKLTSPELFWGKNSIPTVAFSDKKFSEETMWRGPIWANINFFMIEALRRSKRNELARELRKKTLDLISNSHGIFEYYNPITGAPPPTAAPAFSWTAAVFVELSIQAAFDTINEK